MFQGADEMSFAGTLFALLAAALLSACGGGDPADAGARVLCASCGASAGSSSPPSPPVAAQAGTAEGYWNGAAGAYVFSTVVLPGGAAFSAYSRTGLIEGVSIGAVTSSGGTLSGSLIDYNGALLTVTPGTLTGNYVARQSLTASLRVGSLAYSLQAVYDPTYDTEVDLADFAGAWSGSAGSRDGISMVNFTLGADGSIAGSTRACSFSGVATPLNPGKHPLRVDLAFDGPSCPFVGRGVTGIAVAAKSGEVRQLLVVGALADGSDGFFGLANR